MIRGVSLDFYGTLVTFDKPMPTMAQFLTGQGYPCSAEIEVIWNTLGWDGHETPSWSSPVSYFAWRRENLEQLVRMVGVPGHLVEDIVHELEVNDRAWTVRAMPGANELLLDLRERGLAVVVCSNWDYPIGQYLEQAGLPTNLPAVVSAEIGYRKPHPAIFRDTAARIALAPGEVLHIGDSWASDVVGAVRTGMLACYLSPVPPAFTLPPSIRHVASLPDAALLIQSLTQPVS